MRQISGTQILLQACAMLLLLPVAACGGSSYAGGTAGSPGTSGQGGSGSGGTSSVGGGSSGGSSKSSSSKGGKSSSGSSSGLSVIASSGATPIIPTLSLSASGDWTVDTTIKLIIYFDQPNLSGFCEAAGEKGDNDSGGGAHGVA